MATAYGQLSMSVVDADNNRASFVDYVKYDDATATLSSLAAAIAVEIAKFDAITDAQVVGASFALQVTLPTSGIKTAPVAGSNVQETGLIQWNIARPGGGTFSQDIPAYQQAGFTGGLMTGTDTPFTDWRDLMLNHSRTIVSQDDSQAYELQSVKGGKKSFRKRG